VAAEALGARRPLAVLSGPSFAPEVARGLPTAVVVASTEATLPRRVQEIFSGGPLRIYAGEDPRGVQLAGALKNVIAIAAGAADGAGLGHSTIAALVTRGLAEIRKLGVAAGGRAETFHGLAGMGDLILTCTGELSRNRRVGQALSRGQRLEDVLSPTASIAEGVATTRAARELALRSGIDVPIVQEVYRFLFEGGSPGEAVARIMGRPQTSEEGELRGPVA
jgi:glycerol-3-phosphate dehydrogenase (NAD(P)+)